MLLAAIFYLENYIHKIPNEFNYLKWVASIIVFLSICALYFFTLRPALIKKRELSLRPTGNPEEGFFTTSPRFDDKYNFFSKGYEQYVQWLKKTKSPVLYLTGPSGSGKSSLINACLAPELEKEKSIKTNLFLLRSYHNPLKELYNALVIDEKTVSQVDSRNVLELIETTSKMLSENEKIIIVLDQFEEFFLLHNSETALSNDVGNLEGVGELKDFFQQFIQRPPKGVHILLSYRDDFQQFIDQLELPARNENINFKQVKLLSYTQAAIFLSSCPGFTVPEKRLNKVLEEAASIDTPITFRPIVLNLLGVILQQMVGGKPLSKSDDNLIRQYILDCLGKELKLERAAILKELLTDFKTARPRTLEELCRSSRLNASQLDNQMIAMQSRGLVRCLDTIETSVINRKWQISHDFVAWQLEKVVYGVSKNYWQRIKPWIAPIILCILILSSIFYSGIVDTWKKKKSIENISNVQIQLECKY